MKTGFIGLGALGRAMVGRLIDEGVEVVVWNRTPEKARDLNVKSVVSPVAVFDECEVVILCVFDSDAVRDVLAMKGGLLEGKTDGKLIIDTTTNHFNAVEEFYKLAGEKGAVYIEAPVLGSIIPASKGALTIVVSGTADGYTRALPYLQKLGNDLFHVEKPGLASKLKVINNLALGSFMATIAETLVLAERAGLSKSEALDIMSVGAANSAVLDAKKEKLEGEDFAPHFSVALIDKDLACVQDFVNEIGYNSALIKAVRDGFARGMDDVHKTQDFSAIYEIYKEL